MNECKKIKEKKIRKLEQNYRKLIFSLKKRQKQNYFDPIELDLSLLFLNRPKKNGNTFPFYVKDNQPFGPAFTMPLLENQISFSYNQKNQYFEYLSDEQINYSITRAEPDPSYQVCEVCKRKFDQYFSHIESQSHKWCLKNSKYQTEIKKFCSNFYSSNNKTE